MIGPGVGPSFYSGVPLPFLGAQFGADFTSGKYQLNGAVYSDPTSLPGWTFTRASTGYAETAAGALVAFASGAPRITDKGLLVEGARTNLLLRSQEFDDANWTKDATTITADAAVAPDGTTTADALYETTATSAHQAQQTTSSLTSGTAYTCTFYAKAGTRSIVSQGIDGLNAWFNLGTGAVGTVEAGLTASIQAMGGGWYRCITTRTPAVTAAKSFGIYACTTDGAVSYTGNAASPALYIWGADLQAGAFPTSYIPTTTASATRAADVPTLTLSSTATGTLVSDALGAPGAGLTKTATHVSLSNADDSTAWVIFGQTNMSGAVTIFRRAAGVNGNIIAGSTFSAGARTKIATRFGSAGGDAVSVNGAAVVTVAAAASPFVMTQLRPGRWASDPGELNNYVRQIILYPTEFTNAQLVAATA